MPVHTSKNDPIQSVLDNIPVGSVTKLLGLNVRSHAIDHRIGKVLEAVALGEHRAGLVNAPTVEGVTVDLAKNLQPMIIGARSSRTNGGKQISDGFIEEIERAFAENDLQLRRAANGMPLALVADVARQVAGEIVNSAKEIVENKQATSIHSTSPAFRFTL